MKTCSIIGKDQIILFLWFVSDINDIDINVVHDKRIHLMIIKDENRIHQVGTIFSERVEIDYLRNNFDLEISYYNYDAGKNSFIIEKEQLFILELKAI